MFFEAVRARLRSAYPVGVFLSGGLDSSSVTGTAQELYRQGRAESRGFTSFSVVFDGLECDERALISDVQAKYGFTAKYLPSANRVRSLDLAPQGFLAGPSKAVAETTPVLESAYQDGIRVLLSGDVGDASIFGSPLVFDLLIRQGCFHELPRHLRLYRHWFGDSWRKILALYCVLPLLPVGVNRGLTSWHIRRMHKRYPLARIPYWLPEPSRTQLGHRDLELKLAEAQNRLFSSPAREADYRALVPPEVCHDYAGWPIQNVRPFADRRLHEFLLAVPPELKFRPHASSDEYYAAGKRLLREALRDVLPESIRTRLTPTHFATLFDEEVRRDWGAYEEAFGPSGRSEAVLRGYVDGPKFWKRLNDLRAGFWGWDFLYIHRVLWLETWLRSLALPRPQLVTVSPAVSSATWTGLAARTAQAT